MNEPISDAGILIVDDNTDNLLVENAWESMEGKSCSRLRMNQNNQKRRAKQMNIRFGTVLLGVVLLTILSAQVAHAQQREKIRFDKIVVGTLVPFEGDESPRRLITDQAGKENIQ